MLDWNLPGTDVFPKYIFRNSSGKSNNSLHLIGLFISSNGTLCRLEDGSFLGLRDELKILGLSDNNLGPEIPHEIFSLPHLIRLDVSKNNISKLLDCFSDKSNLHDEEPMSKDNIFPIIKLFLLLEVLHFYFFYYF